MYSLQTDSRKTPVMHVLDQIRGFDQAANQIIDQFTMKFGSIDVEVYKDRAFMSMKIST
jgi:hypothetical protein